MMRAPQAGPAGLKTGRYSVMLPPRSSRWTGPQPVKSGIHPKYNEIKVTCSCGRELVTRSTLSEDIRVEVCSSCHPFFTGSQRIMESAGQIEKFRRRYGSRKSA